ncbi:aminotransferase class V-fold PLP-dependent enzyme [Hamadaea tsunoensis]|uniref:aminotransferase class V-fold PLP-dependent enzyme n=1 Tax=Hamadaea tsunoensis TaxID=53368 RepID=UPI0004172331|nr:aminotransferase class V-fold PLP-dependent enzyme [Hamadaea tsunoensis]
MIFPGGRELFGFDPAVSYLNHGSFGAVPLPVREAHRALLDEVDANPMAWARRLPDRVAAARERLARFLGADPAACALIANATTATALVLHSLRVRPGDEIVTTDHAYNAVMTALERFAGRTGAVVRVVPIGLTAGDDEIVEALAAAVRPRTRLAIVDHVASASAKLFPIERISAVLRAAGIPLLVDAAHTPGMFDAEVDRVGADFWVGNFHKWGLAPRATALMAVAPQWRESIEPLVVSHSDPLGWPQSIEHQGTRDLTAWLAAPAALDLLESLGLDRVRAYSVQIAAYTQRVVAEAIGAPVIETGAGVPMRVIPLPAGVAPDQTAVDRLRARIGEELGVEINLNLWRDTALLRVSGQIYVRSEDGDRLAAGLPRLLG